MANAPFKKSEHMLEKVESTLKRYNMINEGETVAVGISGGADSVALFLMLCEYQKSVNFTIKAVHINHMIRQEAKDDEEFVKRLCMEKGVSLECFEIDIPSFATKEHLSTEEAGRIARYRAFNSLNTDKIAVGHHKDDVAETIILNMCRGSGLHGMTGIAPVLDNIIRPLLHVTRQEIEAYLSKIGQSYKTDQSNFTEDYARNRIRLNILPYLKKEINEGAITHICDMAGDMLELEEYIDSEIERIFDKICFYDKRNKSVKIGRKELSELNPYIARELVLKALELLTPKRKDISRVHVNGILGLLKTLGEKHLDLPYDIEVIASYEDVFIERRKNKEMAEVTKKAETKIVGEESKNLTGKNVKVQREISLKKESEIVTLWDGTIVNIRKYPYTGEQIFEDIKYTKCFDYDKIKCSPIFRQRQSGDYLTVNDSGQTKSLKEYMINEKIPKHKRDKLPVLSDGNHIIWVLGYRMSAYYKVKKSTKTILEIVVKTENNKF